MSKAEDTALNKYPVLKTELGDINYLPRICFIEGYHQAEIDLELTVDDIMKVDALLIEMWNRPSNEDKYQDVLKRFKERKEK